ncbi:hypothetical protein, partial [Paenibacillus larvae]
NQKGIKDYRILNGMELGKLIELNTQKKQEEEEESAVVQQIQELIRNNSLIRLTVLKARGIFRFIMLMKKSVPFLLK